MWITDLDEKTLANALGKVDYKNSYIGDTRYKVALVPCGFDIETTHEFMYVWTCTIRDTTIFGSTWNDFRTLLDMLKKLLTIGLDEGHIATVLPIFVHNFGGFEWHFMKSEFNFTNKFCIGMNALYGIIDDSFLFLDSYRICPNKLEDLAKMYSTYRKTHDLDYHIERNTEDGKHLTAEEMEYCANDTRILSDFATHMFEFLNKYGNLPITQNKMIKTMIDYEYNKDKETYDNMLDHLFPTKDLYAMIRRWGFRGGFCQSSIDECDKTGYADLDSAYCSGIIHGYYPMTRYRKRNPKLFEQYIDTHCCQMFLHFKGLESKSFLHYELKSHTILDKTHSGLYSEDIKCDDAGRVVSAKELYVSLTEIDYKLYKMCYSWDSVECVKLVVSERGKLPKYVIDVALELYGNKAKLKKAGLEGTQEYKREKSKPSTIFGAMCQRIYNDDLDLTDEEWYETFKGKKLLPQWGVYVTAYVRNIMVRMALSMGGAYWMYSDTDSFYYDYDDEIKELLEDYNTEQRERNKAMCEEYGLDYNIYDNLGCFDFGERKSLQITRFKTFGSKAYMYEYTDSEHTDPAIKVVLGGIPKECFWESQKASGKSPFDYFAPDSEITYTQLVPTLKTNTHAIINGEHMYCKSGIELVEKSITTNIRDMRIAIVYNNTLNDQNDGVVADI